MEQESERSIREKYAHILLEIKSWQNQALRERRAARVRGIDLLRPTPSLHPLHSSLFTSDDLRRAKDPKDVRFDSYARVAKESGHHGKKRDKSYVSRVANGLIDNAIIVRLIRADWATVDALLATSFSSPQDKEADQPSGL